MDDDRGRRSIEIRCPYDQACHGCFIILDDPGVFQCPKYPERHVRLERRITASGTEYICLTLGGADGDQ